MRTCAIALLFAGFAALPAVAAASPQDGDDLFDPKTELTRSLDQLQKAESYTFETTSNSESDQGRGRGGWARPGTKIEGKYHALDGITGTSGDTELARMGDTVVYKDDQGKWHISRSSGSSRRDRDRGRGREGEREGREGRRRGYERLRSYARGMQHAGFDAPHKRFEKILDMIESIELADKTERVDKQECVVFKAELTADGAKSLMGSGSSRGWGGRGREGGESQTPTTYTGTATFWVDDNWNLRKVETVVVRTITWGDRDYGTKETKTAEFSDHGNTEVELPRKAETALKEAAEEQAESRGNED